MGGSGSLGWGGVSIALGRSVADIGGLYDELEEGGG